MVIVSYGNVITIESDMSPESIEYYSKRMYYGDVKSKKVSA